MSGVMTPWMRALLPLLVMLVLVVKSCASMEVTALEGCHSHGKEQFCIAIPTTEVVRVMASQRAQLPKSYTNCLQVQATLLCRSPEGEDVVIEIFRDLDTVRILQAPIKQISKPAGDNSTIPAPSDDFSATVHPDCEKSNDTYTVSYRIWSILAVLFSSAIAVSSPLFLRHFYYAQTSSTSASSNLAFTSIKQFGTGVIVSTAYIHLLMHATVMYASKCVGKLPYDSFPTAIAMAGGFSAFVVEFGAHRFADGRAQRKKSIDEAEIEVTSRSEATPLLGGHHHALDAGHGQSDDKLGLAVMELGVVFHSFLVGMTLVLTGDTKFATLLIVIVFHQMFEGLALGSRIESCHAIKLPQKLLYCAAFALVTPLGMAVGLFARNGWDEHDPSVMLWLGGLEAFCAGILLWVGLVEMWAGDWLFGELKEAGAKKTFVAMGSLVCGMVFMGVLGIWA